MAKTLSLDVTSIKFEDNETDLKFIASNKGIIVSESTLSATVKIKQVEVGYLKSISAKWVNNHIVISSGDLSDLPVGSYLVELWLGNSNSYEIYPDSGFVRLYIKENATGIYGNLVSSITLGEFQKQFNDLSTELRNNIANGIADTTADYTWTGTNTFNKKIIAPAGVQGDADTATKLQTPRKINDVSFDGSSDIFIDPTTRTISSPTNLFNLTNGFYYNAGSTNTNSPADATTYYTVEVIQTSTNGYMVLVDNDNKAYWTTKTANTWQQWHKISDDAKSVHNSGDEVIFGKKTFSDGIIASLTGNADTATNLKTSRLVGGVPFDGGSNIDLPGVNKTGNQDTSGRAANATHADRASSADLATKTIALQTPRKINGTNFDGTADINVNAANDSNLVHLVGNETIAGNKTFTNLINGALSTRASTFTDFAIVATKMFDYAGTWYVNGTSILNKPSDVGNYLVVKVTPANIPGSGKIEVFEFTSGKTYISNVAMNTLGQWVKVANDSTVVHNTGTETVAGDKTFTGNSTFTQLIDGYTKTSVAPNTDVNLITKQGKYVIDSSYTNIPLGMPNQAILIVENNVLNDKNYQIILSRDVDGLTNGDVDMFLRLNIDSTWTPWRKFAQDQQVLHNTGTETVAGNKTFTGNNNFSGTTTLKAGNYGLRVTTTGIQKTSDNGVTWTNI